MSITNTNVVRVDYACGCFRRFVDGAETEAVCCSDPAHEKKSCGCSEVGGNRVDCRRHSLLIGSLVFVGGFLFLLMLGVLNFPFFLFLWR